MNTRLSWILGIACLALVILVFGTVAPHREGFRAAQQPPTIFVSIASYRDTECMDTLNDLFAKAKRPEQVFVGICEQNSANSKEECKAVNFKYHDNVRRIQISHKEAKGPTFARYLCSTLYRGEKYFMQIDSHTTFVKNWDVIALEQLNLCPTPAKSILSTYPHDVGAYSIDETSVPIICDSEWTADGIVTFKAVIKPSSAFPSNKPRPVPFTSGGFLFAPGTLVSDVKYDPGLPGLFMGEELLYTARAWTSGYDIFSPAKNIVLHYYYRDKETKDASGKTKSKGSKFWDDIPNWHVDQKASMLRCKKILGLAAPAVQPGSDPYSLGSARTIQQYWTFAGLDSVKKTSESKAKFC